MKLDDTETKTVKQFIIIVLILIVVALLVYFLTAKFVNKSDNTSDTENSSTTTEYIDPTKAIVGTMLNKSDGEYYVILYSSEDEDAGTYKNLVTSYSKNDKALTVYTVDLANYLNQSYVATDDTTNPKADNLSDLKFGAITVIKVKNNKITNAYESVSAIKKVWKIS